MLDDPWYVKTMKELQKSEDEYARMSEFQKRLRIGLKDDLDKMSTEDADRLVMELMAWAQYLLDCVEHNHSRREASDGGESSSISSLS